MTERMLPVRIHMDDGTIGWANVPHPRYEYCRFRNQLFAEMGFNCHAEVPDDDDALMLDLQNAPE